jgi:hypothetical protein
MSEYYRHLEWKAAVGIAIGMFALAFIHPGAFFVMGALLVSAIAVLFPVTVVLNS